MRARATGALHRGEADRGESKQNNRLQKELAATKEYLQSLIEQQDAANEELQSVNEEVQSSNEELQSLNEELETFKEELQATNEELTTVNEELQNRNREVNQLNNDLLNLLNSVNIPILMLGPDLRIRRFTSVTERAINVIGSDLGRPISHIKLAVDIPDLEQSVLEVIDTVTPKERELQDRQGRWLSLRVRPYRTFDNKIDGAVVMLLDVDKLKRSEQEMEYARRSAEVLVETMHEPLLLLESNLKVQRANCCYYETFQVAPAQTEGRFLYELGNGQWNLARLRGLLEEILPRNQQFDEFEVDAEFEGIGRRRMLLNARRILSEDGQHALILLAMEDITELKRVEAALRESEERYRLLTESSRDCIHELDLRGGLVDMNFNGLCQMEIEDFSIFQHQSWFNFWKSKDEEKARAAVPDALNKGISRFQGYCPTAKGTPKWWDVAITPLRDAAGKSVRLLAFARDNTEIKRAEDASRKLAAIVESSDDAILSYDLKGIIISWNQAAERLYGYTAKEAIGQPAAMLIPPERRDEGPDILERIRRGERIEHHETVRRRKDGTLVEISLTVSPVKDTQGNIIGASKIARDITERKRDEQMLREAKEQLAKYNEELEKRVKERTSELMETNSQLEAFVYSISHDLRSPLRALEACSRMLLDDYGGRLDDTALEYVRRINGAAEFMDKLVLDLVEFGRTARADFDLDAVNVEATWAAALFQCQHQIQETQARVEVTSPLPVVRAHEATLSQALANLLANALRFVAPGVRPEVRFRAEEKADTVRLWVEDNGIGIPPEHHERIFRVFERLHGRTYGGTGIGLAIVRKGVERMVGRVGLESATGEGSRFWIELAKG